MDRLLTPEDLAELLGIPVKTLYRWRHVGVGPQAMKVGKHLRYLPDDVQEYIDALREDTTNSLR